MIEPPRHIAMHRVDERGLRVEAERFSRSAVRVQPASLLDFTALEARRQCGADPAPLILRRRGSPSRARATEADLRPVERHLDVQLRRGKAVARFEET